MGLKSILLVTDIFPPKIGGPATFIPHLAERLASQYGYRVTVVCSSDSPTDEADQLRSYRVRRLCPRDSLRYKLAARELLIRELLTHDCVLINGLEALTCQIARTLRRPYLLKVVGDPVWEAARNTGRTLLDFDRFQADSNEQQRFAALVESRNRRLLLARQVVTPSQYLKRIVMGWGVPQERVKVIPNGVELERFSQIPYHDRTGGPLEVLFVGRLTNWKGVETLLLAASQVRNVQITIVGDGPEYPHLVELARQLNVTNTVEFTGRLSPTEVEKRMAAAHVLVLTSLYEGLSHTLLEALAAGLPCIVSKCGGNSEVIAPGQNGLLIEPQNVRELVSSLALLESEDDILRSMSIQARAGSSDFAIDLTVEKYIELLTQ